jgi:hypothetical protein
MITPILTNFKPIAMFACTKLPENANIITTKLNIQDVHSRLISYSNLDVSRIHVASILLFPSFLADPLDHGGLWDHEGLWDLEDHGQGTWDPLEGAAHVHRNSRA